jgi:hypothetical protein
MRHRHGGAPIPTSSGLVTRPYIVMNQEKHMPAPVLAVFGLAVVAGVGLTLGKRLVTKVLEPNWKDKVEPWIREQAENFNQWGQNQWDQESRAGRSGGFDETTTTTAGTEGAAPTTASPNDGTEVDPPAPARS